MPPVVFGVIPARGGSKGIPRKNLRPIAGKPLVAWTIEAAQQATRLTRWVVSTEDPEIAACAEGMGASVLWRPPELASDEASTLAVLEHALEQFPADIIVVLQPTSPIRGAGLIDACLERFLQTGAESLGTVRRDFNYEYGVDMPRRQEMMPRWLDTGCVYVIAATVVKRGRALGDRIATFETSAEEAVDVDEEFDLWLAEQILLHRPPAPWTAGRVAKAEVR